MTNSITIVDPWGKSGLNEYMDFYIDAILQFNPKVKVITNSTNVIPLDKYNFHPNELPVFICRSMAGVPFGLGIGKNNKMLSLEHTHPPASFAVHGERYGIQGEIKRQWFSILKNN